MKLVIGLGNPEQKYTDTRHNVGFAVLDAYADSHELSFAHSSKFHGDIAEQGVGEHKVIFLKPTTYYNLVGESARAVCDFYHIEPTDVLIIHDDLALPLGTIRTRTGGSDAGNNGLKSLNAHLGSSTQRVRIGVWHEAHHGADKVAVVLGKFTRKEREILQSQQPKIEEIVDSFIAGEFQATTHSGE